MNWKTLVLLALCTVLAGTNISTLMVAENRIEELKRQCADKIQYMRILSRRTCQWEFISHPKVHFANDETQREMEAKCLTVGQVPIWR